MHSSISKLPAGEVESVGHEVQEALPIMFLYLPLAHAWHVPPSPPVPAKPGLHIHAPAELLAEEEVSLSSGHEVHIAVPAISLYLPFSHSTHIPPSGPENPGRHVQL